MRHPPRINWVGIGATLLLLSGAACSSGSGGGADGSAGAGGSDRAGSGGGASQGGSGGGTAQGGTQGGAAGQAGGGATGGASAGGQSGSHGATGAAGAPATGDCNVIYDCPTGQTCDGPGGRDFSCVPSGPGKAGDACDTSSTTVQCGDQLLCAGTQCIQICDATHPCPSNKTCTTIATQADEFLNICE